MTCITIVHVNARSLPRHFDDVAALVSSHRPDVLALSETWLDSSIDDKEISLPGFVLFRLDRNRYGGGVAIYCADYLSCSVITNGPTASGVEFLWVSVNSPQSHSSFALGCFYRPPSANSHSVQNICDNIESMLLSWKNLIACGDFNIDLSDNSKPFVKTFQNFLTSHILYQLISEPTHFSDASNSILDLFITSSDIPVAKSQVLQSSFSDHLPILLEVKLLVPKPPPTLITRRSFKMFSQQKFLDDLKTTPWHVMDLFEDLDDKIDTFNKLFGEVLDTHAPLKTVRVKKNPTPWITKSIQDEMDRRDRLFRFYRRNPTSDSKNIYRAQRNRVVWLQRKAKYNYFHRLFKRNAQPSAIWNTLKLATSTFPSSSWSSFNTDPVRIANSLNNHFATVSSSNFAPSPDSLPPLQPFSPSILNLSKTTPDSVKDNLATLKRKCATGIDNIPSSALIDARSVICHPLCSIINSSIFSSTFPKAWKCASIVPLHKSGDRTTPSNYRPISLLPVASKLLEKHVQKQLSSHLNQNDLLFPFQSGFRQNHSTESLLLFCLDQWYKALDNKKYVGVVFLDISKAFDTVNHNLLLLKLSRLGLSPSTIAWFKSYLSDRCHQTRVENAYSSLGFPTNGVPQGSTLGPTLFSAFINDLPSVLPPNSTVLFADDTTVFLISDDIQELNSSLQLTLDLANLWLQRNGLKLNTSKTKSMLIHSARKKLATN